MPPKRNVARTAKNEGSDSDTDHNTDHEADRTVVSSPNVTMSEEMLQNLVSSITRSQMEASRVLIDSILSSNRGHPCTSSPRPDTPGHTQRPGNFSKCTARFDGTSKNADELEAFIDAIEVFRECTNVSDEHALRGLPMLLAGDAAVWWQGVKASVLSWTEALQRLRGMYGVPRPGYKILRDIFACDQSSDRADVFICKVRALIMKLPYTVPEDMKIDIVYGLLDRKIRKRVSRDTVDGLEQLISKYWLCVVVLLTSGIFFAVINLYWKKVLTIFGTSVYGGAVIATSLDYFFERMMMLKWLWERAKLEPAVAPPCRLSWLTLAAWPAAAIVGLTAQCALTATGIYHEQSISAQKRRLKAQQSRPVTREQRAEMKQRKYRYLYQVRTAHGDVISQSYVQALQKKAQCGNWSGSGGGECSTLQSDSTHLTVLAPPTDSDDELNQIRAAR